MNPQAGFAPNVMTLGKGARRVLALHCTMAFGGAWSRFSKAAPELMLIAPDMPSHGRSPDWDEVSDFNDTVYQMSLEQMDDQPMDVIGHSFGAATALRIAIQHPEKVRSLTVFEPVFFAIAKRDAPETMGQHDSDAKPYTSALAAGDRALAARLFNRMWSSGTPAWPDLPERNRAAMIRAIHVVPNQRHFLFDDAAEMIPALPGLTVPTLVMRGELAHASVVAVNDGIAARMPTARQAVIAGAGHMAPVTHPQEVAQEVAAFLADT